MTLTNDYRIEEVFMQMIDVLENTVLKRPAGADIVENGEVLHILAQAYPAGVWADGNTEFGGHQDDSQCFIDASQAAAVDLTEADRLRLEKLLENDPFMTMLSGRHSDRSDCFGDSRVTKNVVRTRRFLDPVRRKPLQLSHVRNRLRHIPNLIGIHHELSIPTYLFADECRPVDILFKVPPHLQLKMCPPIGDRLAYQPSGLIARITKPTHRCSICR